MQTIPLTDLIIATDRQRQEFEPASLVELAASIKEHGLFHAILITADGKLVAGERRVRAIRDFVYPLGGSFTYGGEPVPLGHIPYTRATGDRLQLEEIELDENMRRKDLTWQEQAETHARLHALRQAQASQHKIYTAETHPEPTYTGQHTIADTAKEVYGRSDGFFQDSIRQEVIVAQHLDKPEVSGAATLKDAYKALKKIEETARNRELAQLVGETFSARDHTVIHANCLEWMTGHQTEFDVILTDPPYGMGAHEFGDAAGRLVEIDHQYDDTEENWRKLMTEWCPLSFAITKPQAHAYVFCDIDRFHELKSLMQAAGWYVFRTPLTNYKRNSGRVPLPDQGPRRQSEWILYAIKGKKNVNLIASDVIVSESDENLTHGAQKPVALYDDLLRRSVKPGDRVLDTFGGTGTLLPACHHLKCRATVIEQSESYYGLCLKRLKELT